MFEDFSGSIVNSIKGPNSNLAMHVELINCVLEWNIFCAYQVLVTKDID